MASIAQSREVLKNPWFPRREFVGHYLPPEDLITAANAAKYTWRERTWPPVLTIWTFLVQTLHPGWSCRAAVGEVLAEHAAAGMALEASPDPSAYCQARKRIPLSVYTHALRTVGQTLQDRIGDAYRWCGRRVWVVDGSSCSMPDTRSLQKAFGQPDRQKPGCGFPVARLVAMFCWAGGAVLDVAIGPYRSNELSLWRQLWDQLHSGDVVLGDRFYGSYADMAQLATRGCDGVFRLRGAQARPLDFRKGKKLGKDDRLFVWTRSYPCPRTLSAQEFALLPPSITVRVLRFHTRVQGFRSRTVLVATTLLDPVSYPLDQIAALYGDRWTVELRIREVKTTLRMDVLRNKSPDTIRKEILMHFVAYNLIRALMGQAAREHGRPLHRLSFAGTMEHFHAMAPYLCLFQGTAHAAALYRLLLKWVASDLPERRCGKPCYTETPWLIVMPFVPDTFNSPNGVEVGESFLFRSSFPSILLVSFRFFRLGQLRRVVGNAIMGGRTKLWHLRCTAVDFDQAEDVVLVIHVHQGKVSTFDSSLTEDGVVQSDHLMMPLLVAFAGDR